MSSHKNMWSHLNSPSTFRNKGLKQTNDSQICAKHINHLGRTVRLSFATPRPSTWYRCPPSPPPQSKIASQVSLVTYVIIPMVNIRVAPHSTHSSMYPSWEGVNRYERAPIQWTSVDLLYTVVYFYTTAYNKSTYAR